ncbi:MAG: peptidoglycan DD-metalloendopeptidase family protein [Clostridia bacterium]|nr:peptidoglycan DD-metalloendopeptidase family protein [Clostridia bacterium]
MKDSKKTLDGERDGFGTDVREDVSRETSRRSIYEKEKLKKPELDKVRHKGNITDDNPFDYNNPSLKELYRDFRANKLSRIESGFNSLYLWCYDNYYSSGVPIKEKYKNIYAHPAAWFRNTHGMWKHNKWSLAVRLLEIIPAISRTFEKMRENKKKFKENFWKTFEYSHKSASKALRFAAYLVMIAATVSIITIWSNSIGQFDMIPALKLYVDGKYVGDVLSVHDAESAKDSVEKSLSVNLGSSFSLDCTIEYEATKIKEGSNLTPARLSRAFGDAAHKEMQSGYGLYVYDVLVAVSSDRTWLEDSINESLDSKLTEKQKKDTEKVSYNNFVIRQGSYPEKFFNTQQEIRQLFSLPENPEDASQTDKETSDYLNISEKTTLLTGKNTAGTSSDVSDEANQHTMQLAIETVITKRVTERETIPYATDYNYTDELPENRRVVTTEGKNGSKHATYIIEYGDDNREISRRLLSEVVISEPTNQVVSQGTRPLTDEEKRTASTGTYIYPSEGDLTSGYSWRVLGGYNEFHRGIDISSSNGLVLVASDGGVVIQAHDRGDGYGRCVLIEHDDGTITRYAHCSKVHVEVGQRVAQGEHIADMGATGQATGVHIHFEIIKDGKTVNPMDYLPKR